METVNTPPRRKRGGQLSVGRRYAMVEIARAIPPVKTRLPKGTVGPLAERYEALNNEMADITTMKSVGTAGTRYSGDYSLYRAAPDIAMIWPLFHT